MSIRSDIEIYAGDLSEFDDIVVGKELAVSVNMAFHRLPDQIMLEGLFPAIQLYLGFTTANVLDKSIIYVERYDANGASNVALEINPILFDNYSKTGSIYEPTKENPVFAIKMVDSNPVINVLPAITGARGSNVDTARVHWKPTYSDLTSQLDSELISNVSNKALRFIILNAALLMLAQKFQMAALEDEDTELAQLLSQSMQALNGLIDAELQRLGAEESSAFNDLALQQMEDPAKGKPTQR